MNFLSFAEVRRAAKRSLRSLGSFCSQTLLGLPRDVTVLQLTFDATDVLYLTRLCSKCSLENVSLRHHASDFFEFTFEAPPTANKNVGEGDAPADVFEESLVETAMSSLCTRLARIVKENKQTTAAEDMDTSLFWKKRRKLNDDLEERIRL